MNIVQTSNDFLQIIKPVFQKKVHKLLEFGFKSLSLQRIVSLSSNARATIANPHTAESKIFRLTNSLRLLKFFPQLMIHLALVADGDSVAADFSDFGGFQVLMFAKRTDKGRALPLYFEILTYPIEKDSQNTFIIEAINRFFEIINPFKVSLVFDRGFACPAIIEDLARKQRVFYIRIKSRKLVIYKKTKHKARDFAEGNYPVYVYRRWLSLTVTAEPLNTDGKTLEPWYIVSNDLVSSERTITDIYYHRFEIEEFFKDAKRIFGLEYICFKKQTSLAIALWFVMLGLWLQRYLEQSAHEARAVIKKCKDSFNQSLTHYWLERIRLELYAPALATIFINDS